MGLKELIGANIASVRERIARAAVRSGRSPEHLTMVAVSKGFCAEYLEAAYELGLRHFGENRVAEAGDKRPAIAEWIAGREQPAWHMVGHLQGRKVPDALQLFDLIHSVDSVRLAQRIDRLCRSEGRDPMPILLEVNTSGEEQKYGFRLDCWPEDRTQWTDFLSDVERILRLPGVKVRGLMTMAPEVEPEATRPCFRRLCDVRDTLTQIFPEADWHELSMGMTNDFEVAVEEGATMLRLGRAIFGPRGGSK